MGMKFRRPVVGVQGRPRAKMYSWSKRELVWVKWGGIVVSLRYHPHRGWTWVTVRRGSPTGDLVTRNAAREPV